MNREARRRLEKAYRRSGLTRQKAKALVDANYRGDSMKEGQKCKFNYELIIRHPQFNKQKDEFKQWVIDHKDDVLTIDKTRNNGQEVTFIEDENKEKFWHHTETLIPVAFATIRLDDGTETNVILDGVTSPDDENISKKINEALEV